jgi:tRNA (mo5U34)-methyltransferase
MLKQMKKLFLTNANKPQVAKKGFVENATYSGQVENLTDDELDRLNTLLPWMCFTADEKGRRFGDMAWRGKREQAQEVPDQRIVKLNQLFDLKDKSVLEVGCFEGVHTIGLCQFAKEVYAVDSRIENVVKTIVRTNMFGYKPTAAVCNIEDEVSFDALPKIDVIHHVGVLYHLLDPIKHLLALKQHANQGILLDTHYATNEMLNANYTTSGGSYDYHRFKEGGRDEVFSGMYDHSKWLTLDCIKKILTDIGFSDVRVLNDELQRNGPRVTLYAAKPNVMNGAI